MRLIQAREIRVDLSFPFVFVEFLWVPESFENFEYFSKFSLKSRFASFQHHVATSQFLIFLIMLTTETLFHFTCWFSITSQELLADLNDHCSLILAILQQAAFTHFESFVSCQIPISFPSQLSATRLKITSIAHSNLQFTSHTLWSTISILSLFATMLLCNLIHLYPLSFSQFDFFEYDFMTSSLWFHLLTSDCLTQVQ